MIYNPTFGAVDLIKWIKWHHLSWTTVTQSEKPGPSADMFTDPVFPWLIASGNSGLPSQGKLLWPPISIAALQKPLSQDLVLFPS